MAKYCKAYRLRVTYLDCMECEDKQCKQTRNASMEDANLQKGEQAMIKRYLELEPEQKVFVVFASKREGYKDNIVIRCNVRECSVRKNTTVYYLTKEKVVLGKQEIKSFIDCFSCENSNIDTGYRGLQMDKYPVFTTKEKCIEWLKG